MMLETLRQELTGDPLDLGYATHIASGNDQALADMLNEVREGIQVHQLVDRTDIKNRLYSTGEILALDDATDPASKMARKYLADPDYARIDLNLVVDGVQVVQGMLTSLRALNVLSQSTVDAIQAMSKRPGSRAEQLGLHAVTVTDVARAVRDDFGNPLIGG